MPNLPERNFTAAKTVRELFDLSGRVAIVSGGSMGLGRQMAQALAEMGANVVLCARKKERCVQAAAELQTLGVKTLALACDVKNPADIHAVVDATLSAFGRIDILINNAGTSWGAPIEEMKLEHWNKVIETNLTGTVLFSQAVGKTMVAQRRGKIINIASVAGLGGAPPEFQAAFAPANRRQPLRHCLIQRARRNLHGMRHPVQIQYRYPARSQRHKPRNY
jgi:gluconate 5-dehydrogenase